MTAAIGAEYLCADFQTERRIQKQQGAIWQHRFWEHLIRDDKDFAAHMDYLYFNPVKHGLVNAVCEWSWSSFHRLVNEGVHVHDWGGNDQGHIVITDNDA